MLQGVVSHTLSPNTVNLQRQQVHAVHVMHCARVFRQIPQPAVSACVPPCAVDLCLTVFDELQVHMLLLNQ